MFPRRFAGSWPDSHSGGGTGFGGGGGGGADWAALPAGGGVVLTGITDSSLALLAAGSCVSPPPAMRAISFVATLVAFEVRWTPSPAQMLVPSTVASSCKGDSSGPKYSRIFRILASEVRAPAAAASVAVDAAAAAAADHRERKNFCKALVQYMYCLFTETHGVLTQI